MFFMRLLRHVVPRNGRRVLSLTIVNDFTKLIYSMSLRASAKQSHEIAASLALLAMTTLFCRLVLVCHLTKSIVMSGELWHGPGFNRLLT